jgi:hypothetical protein
MVQVVRQALDVLARLLLEALNFEEPRKPPIRDGVERPADDVAILRHQTLKVLLRQPGPPIPAQPQRSPR